MKKGEGNGDAFTWSGVCEISDEAKSLSALLPDAGRSSESQLAHVDTMRPIFRVRSVITAIRDASHQAPARGNSNPVVEG